VDREDVFEYVNEKYSTMPEYLWRKNPAYAVLKHANNKWYGIIMNVPKEKIGLEGNEEVDIINVKCPPDMIGNLRSGHGFIPAYHMNKEHWITILLDSSVKDEQVKQLIDLSYELTKK
jgi:hypothetical protein